MSDPTARLARLRKRLATTDDPEERADLEAAIDALAQQLDSAEVPTESRTHIQHIREYTTIQAAVAGDVHGDIYIVGERTESTKVLLGGYLRWLASQCGQLPLRGVREQKAATDVLNIGLDQVYTQLATSEKSLRDVFSGAALQSLDAEAYLRQHTGGQLLPADLRISMEGIFPDEDDDDREYDSDHEDEESEYWPVNIERQPNSLENILIGGMHSIDEQSAKFITRYIAAAEEIQFFGPQLVTEAIATNSRLVLLGEPGSGKSTALRYLALTLAHAGMDSSLDLTARLEGWQSLGEAGRLIPLFIPLLPLAQRLAAQPGRNGTAADLWAAIDTHLTNHGATANIITAMRMELGQGHVLLLLDGLDEVAGGESRRQVVQAVQAFAVEQSQCRIVVACRVRAYEGQHNAAWQLPGWPSATLADWTPGQVRAFIKAWYTAAATVSHLPIARRDERIAVLQWAVTERDDLKRLSSRPLLLTIMALVHLNDGRLPEDRVTLYSRCLDILLSQWEIGGKDATEYGTLMQYIGLPDADVKGLRPLLTRVAYAAHQAAGQGEVGRLRRADLRELLADALEQLKHPNPYHGAKRFLEYTDVRAGLLQASEAGDAYAFPHQTFQEYLTGLELISGVGFVDQIMARRNEDRWRIPIFLGIGHAVSEGLLSAPYQLLNRLLHANKRTEAHLHQDLVFAAELAEDVGWERLERGGEEFTVLRRDLANALSRVVQGVVLPADKRVHAGTLLGQLGDPRPRMVVACRVRAYVGDHNAAWQLPSWSSVTLADWIPGQVHTFIGAWYTAAAAVSHMPVAKRDEQITLLQHAVAERDDLKRLSIRPLLLTIMALVHLNDGRLPEDRVTLYSRCLDILLGQWEIAGKDATDYGTLMQYIGLPDADVRSLRSLLTRVAYAAQQAAGQGEVGRLRRADLRELVEDALEQLKHPNPHNGAKRFLEYTDVRAGLLQASDAGDAYAFPHQTFQEYLAGLELSSGAGFIDRIMAVRTDDRWRVPIFLGIGHTVSEGLLSIPYQLLNRLLHAGKRDESQRQRDLILAAEIAEDVSWERLEHGGEEFGALRAELAKALAQVVEGTALPATDRIHAGMLLGRLGDLREGVCTLPPAMVSIRGGNFVIGNTTQELIHLQSWYSDTENMQPVTIATFDLARYPVTNAQFRQFKDDGGYWHDQSWWDVAGKNWLRDSKVTEPHYWNGVPFVNLCPNHPVIGVTWYEAIAFCRWLTQTLNDGYEYCLPSEAEWEYAARGSTRRIYPWGAENPDGERANFEEIYTGTTAVGCFVMGATPEGVFDLAGNVWEWTRSEYRPYPYYPDDGREVVDEPVGKTFIVRGGSWGTKSVNLRASDHVDQKPGKHNFYNGFRLARHVKVQRIN